MPDPFDAFDDMDAGCPVPPTYDDLPDDDHDAQPDEDPPDPEDA